MCADRRTSHQSDLRSDPKASPKMIQEGGPGLNDPPAEPATPPNGKRMFSFEPTPTKKKKDDVREFLGSSRNAAKRGIDAIEHSTWPSISVEASIKSTRPIASYRRAG